jgi:hypothetical protein
MKGIFLRTIALAVIGAAAVMRGDPRFKGTVAVLIKEPDGFPEIASVVDKLGVGLYPEKERAWDYAVPLKNGFIIVNSLLADEIRKGNQISMRTITSEDGQTKQQIYLKRL